MIGEKENVILVGKEQAVLSEELILSFRHYRVGEV